MTRSQFIDLLRSGFTQEELAAVREMFQNSMRGSFRGRRRGISITAASAASRRTTFCAISIPSF